jgi:uncharacterized membrane protein
VDIFFWKIYPKSAYFGGIELPKHKSVSDLPTSLERPWPAHHVDALKIEIIFQMSMVHVVKVASWSLCAKLAQVLVFPLSEKNFFWPIDPITGVLGQCRSSIVKNEILPENPGFCECDL